MYILHANVFLNSISINKECLILLEVEMITHTIYKPQLIITPLKQLVLSLIYSFL